MKTTASFWTSWTSPDNKHVIRRPALSGQILFFFANTIGLLLWSFRELALSERIPGRKGEIVPLLRTASLCPPSPFDHHRFRPKTSDSLSFLVKPCGFFADIPNFATGISPLSKEFMRSPLWLIDRFKNGFAIKKWNRSILFDHWPPR